MTFNELRADFRRDVFADPTTDVFADATLDTLLFNAASEIAAMLRFPQAVATGATAVDQVSITAPADMAGVAPTRLIVNGFDLKLDDYSKVIKMRTHADFPTVFNWDARRGGVIEFAPKSLVVGTYTLVYTQAYEASGLAAGDELWLGNLALQKFAHVVLYRAGDNLYRSLEMYERAREYQGMFQSSMQAFAANLGLTDIGNLIVPPEVRNDRGAEAS